MGRYEAALRAAQMKNLTKTAQELGYSQSSVSRIIRNLEDELGVPLFHRDRYGVSLTRVGAELQPVMEQIEGLERELHRIAATHRAGAVRVGSIYSVSNYWIPPILKRFAERHPKAKVTIVEQESYASLDELLKREELECTFFVGNVKTSFEFIPLYRDPYYVIVGADHPLARQERVSIEVITRYPFIMPSEALDRSVSQDIVRRFQMDGGLDLVAQSQEDHATISLVEHGLGISFLPGLIAKNTKRDIRAIPLIEDHARDLGILCPSYRDASPLTKDFIRETKRYVARAMD